jgi:Fe-Mn family superoxide dismutase
MPINFPELPYAKDALEPHVSARTMEFHHDKHHKAYVDNSNKLLSGNPLEKEDIKTIIKKTANDPKMTGIFNNVAQAWNHTFFWNCMKKGGGKKPSGPIADKINTDFGSYDKFVEEFKAAGATLFGSGWVWLVLDDGKLKVLKTPNGENPIIHDMTPLLGIDVWEHSYYLDYQNRRPDYLSAFIDNLINWDFVNTQLKEYQQQTQESKAHH